MPKDISNKSLPPHAVATTSPWHQSKSLRLKTPAQEAVSEEAPAYESRNNDDFQSSGSSAGRHHNLNEEKKTTNKTAKISIPHVSMTETSAKNWRLHIPKIKLSRHDDPEGKEIGDAEQYYKDYLSEELWRTTHPESNARSMDLEISMSVPGSNRIIKIGSYLDLKKDLRTEVFTHKLLQLPQNEHTVYRESGLQAIAVISLMISAGILGLKEPVLASQLDRFIPKDRRHEAYGMAMKTFYWAKDLSLYQSCIHRGASVTYHSIYDDTSLLEFICKRDASKFTELTLNAVTSLEHIETIEDIIESNNFKTLKTKELLESTLQRLRSLEAPRDSARS